MNEILVTGAAGLFGSNFCKYLCDQGYSVIGVDNLFGGYRDFVDPRVIFYKMDLEEFDLVQELFDNHNIQYVYHFAAYAAAGLSPFVRKFNYENNVIASSNLINESINHNIEKFIFASSLEVYGDQKPPYDETFDLKPNNPYGIAKMAIEKDLENTKQFHGLDYSIVRPHCVHGENQNIWDKYRNVIGIFIRKALNEENLIIYGDGLQVRSFSDIQYYMEPMEKLMHDHSGEVFNIGADHNHTIIEVANLVKYMADQYGYNVDIEYAEPRNETRAAYCNHDKAKRLLGFEDHTILEDLIKRMVDWAENQPTRKVKNMQVEVDKNLYSYWR